MKLYDETFGAKSVGVRLTVFPVLLLRIFPIPSNSKVKKYQIYFCIAIHNESQIAFLWEFSPEMINVMLYSSVRAKFCHLAIST